MGNESDFVLDNQSANCNGATVDFTLANAPIIASVQVYLNGLLQEEGSGKDYVLHGVSDKTITFATAPESLDLLIIPYVKNN